MSFVYKIVGLQISILQLKYFHFYFRNVAEILQICNLTHKVSKNRHYCTFGPFIAQLLIFSLAKSQVNRLLLFDL